MTLHRTSAVSQLKMAAEATQVWACAVNLCHTTQAQALLCLASSCGFPPVLWRAEPLGHLAQSPVHAEPSGILCCVHGESSLLLQAQNWHSCHKTQTKSQTFTSCMGVLPIISSQLDCSLLLFSPKTSSPVAWLNYNMNGPRARDI